MKTAGLAPLAVFAVLGLLACGPSDKQNTAAQRIIERWKGSQPHFEATGSVAGKTFSITLSADDAATLEYLNLTRKFCVPDTGDPTTWSAGYIYDIDLNVRDRLVKSYVGDVFGAAFDKFEVSIEGRRFDALELGAELEVIPGTATIGPEQVKVRLTIADKDQPPGVSAENDLFGAHAEAGAVAFGVWSGNPADGNPPPAGEGPTGGVVWARWSETDELFVSFSAYAEHNKLKDPIAEPAICIF